MKAGFPVLLTSFLAVALAVPGAMGKEKDKDKDKKKDKVARSEHDDRDRGREGDHEGNGSLTICHVPPGNASARHTITVSESAWDAHRKHGDYRGACGRSDHDHDGDGNGRDAFDRLDRNNDGRLSAAEWPHGNESFRRLDRNGDGSLSRDEYRRY